MRCETLAAQPPGDDDAIPAWPVMLGFGLLFTFAPDLTWELQHLSNSLDGEASERSEAWEFKRRLWAGLSFVLGGLLIFISF